MVFPLLFRYSSVTWKAPWLSYLPLQPESSRWPNWETKADEKKEGIRGTSSSHPEHPLTWLRPRYGGGRWISDVCRVESKGLSWHCAPCQVSWAWRLLLGCHCLACLVGEWLPNPSAGPMGQLPEVASRWRTHSRWRSFRRCKSYDTSTAPTNNAVSHHSSTPKLTSANQLRNDVRIIAAVSAVVGVLVVVNFRRIKVYLFDSEYAQMQGVKVTWVRALLSSLVAMSVAIGIQTAGAILMASLLVAPAATARQWTSRLLPMVFVALVVGVLGGTMGTVLSCASPNMPTGPWVVISMTLLFAVSVAMQWVSGRVQSSQKG